MSIDFKNIIPIGPSEMQKLNLYEFSTPLASAIETAMLLGLPLFLTGEPGTGKSQAAWKLADKLGAPLFDFHTKSTSSSQDLLYQYDMMQHYADVNIFSKSENRQANETEAGTKKTFSDYKNKGPFYQAIEFQNDEKNAGKQCVILIDEIDKAPRDFPNDLLHEIEKYAFTIKETNETIALNANNKPIIIITSNSEKSMPDAFMRRCIFHHITFDDKILDVMIDKYADKNNPVFEKAKNLFLKIREKPLNKKPATAEFINWLILLGKMPVLSAQQSLSTILKNTDDIKACLDLFAGIDEAAKNENEQSDSKADGNKETA